MQGVSTFDYTIFKFETLGKVFFSVEDLFYLGFEISLTLFLGPVGAALLVIFY